jgi:uncharacterized membrane protein YedE/YeeE
MKETLAGLITGFIFGLGLCLSGMANPAVVLGFLDFAGDWNPALIFVMAGGVVVSFIGYRLVLGRAHPLWSAAFHLPASTAIDAPLISGAVIFGIGWGLAGYCPGPVLASLAGGRAEVVVFVVSMLVGMIAVRWLRRRPEVSMAPTPEGKSA